MSLFDTHCHIHEAEGDSPVAEKWHKHDVRDPDELVREAIAAGVSRLMIVGCTVQDSEAAVRFAVHHDTCYASIGVHPHEAEPTLADQALMQRFEALAAGPGVTAIGECGLDYFYTHSPKSDQLKVLRWQLELAATHGKPLIFHVREAFEDFWPVFDDFTGLTGVLHSFTATQADLEQAMSRGLYIGLNGIMTFTKDEAQLEMAKAVPADRLVLETDAPYLTPNGFRGKINRPAYVRHTAAFLAGLRGEPLETLAATTTANARRLFGV